MEGREREGATSCCARASPIQYSTRANLPLNESPTLQAAGAQITGASASDSKFKGAHT